MTSSAAVGRLSSVLHGGTGGPINKSLTRQQTFPPPQPYVRMRYMSATVEMSTCTETVHEGIVISSFENFKFYYYLFSIDDSRSNSSHSSHDNISNPPQYTIPSIAVLSPNNGRPSDVLLLSSSDSPPAKSTNSNNKREPEYSDKEKSYKIAKLSETGQKCEKENVDPRSSANVSIRRLLFFEYRAFHEYFIRNILKVTSKF